MKTRLFYAITLFSMTLINAQEKEETNYGFDEKDIFISGSIGYKSIKQGDFKSNSFSFSPSVGYFLSENISLDAGLIFSSLNNNQFIDQEESSFGGSLGATYFFNPLKQFSFTLGLHGTYQHRKIETNGNSDVETNALVVTFSPGINYFVSENFALTANVGALSYVTSKQENVFETDRYNQFGINLNLSNINFGAIYKF